MYLDLLLTNVFKYLLYIMRYRDTEDQISETSGDMFWMWYNDVRMLRRLELAKPNEAKER